MLKVNNNRHLCRMGGGVERSNNRHFDGFTLAEILITIGIIGVVAAITIPLLIQNSNSKKFVTQFKKSLSTLNQAAISAQAQYDMDYSLLTRVNDDTTCKTDTLADGNYSICGLFNNTLAAQTYLGRYGNVKAANGTGVYSANVSSFSVNDFLFFSFADGAFVAFNPNAKGCGVGAGKAISTDMITSGQLANCLGFIDVNGPTPPNKEVQCAEGTTTLSVNTTCKVTNGSMGDIFPVVFHDGAVEPATNAALAAFLGGNGKEGGSNSAASAAAPKKITYNGQEYELKNGIYVRDRGDGNYIGSNGSEYIKHDDGYYYATPGNMVYDKDMKEVGVVWDNKLYTEKFEANYGSFDSNGNFITGIGGPGALVYTKREDGNYEFAYSSSPNNKYIYDRNGNPLRLEASNGQVYEAKGSSEIGGAGTIYAQKDTNGNYVTQSGTVYTKRGDGNYEWNNGGSFTYIYDNNLNRIGVYKGDDYYSVIGNECCFKKDSNGNYQSYDNMYNLTKRADGLYDKVSPWGSEGIYDDEMNLVHW